MSGIFSTLAAGLAATFTMAAATVSAVALGETQQLAPDIAITPLAVVEDSRCPPDVMCIQAGRLVVEAELRHGADTSRLILALGEQMRVKGGMLTFAYATPPAPARGGSSDETPPLRLGYSYTPDTAG